MLHKKSTIQFLALAGDVDNHRAAIHTKVDGVFRTHASKGVAHCRRVEDLVRAVNGHAKRSVSDS